MTNKTLIVGLGNPGTEYELTRHNAGAMLLSFIKNKWGFPEFKDDKYAEARMSDGNSALLVFPQTYMNNSGKTVSYLLQKYPFSPSELLLLHDDKDLTLGEFKLQKGISSAGHKGVQSVIDSIDTNEFWRLRIGIGPVPQPLSTDTFVLQKFLPEEINRLKEEIFPEVAKKLAPNPQ